MVRSLYVLGALACLGMFALVLLAQPGGAVRPRYPASPVAIESAPVEGALMGAATLSDMASLPTPNGP